MATSRISAFTLGLAAKLTDASTFVGNDSDGITRKWTLALLRTQLSSGPQVFPGTVAVTGAITCAANITLTANTGGVFFQALAGNNPYINCTSGNAMRARGGSGGFEWADNADTASPLMSLSNTGVLSLNNGSFKPRATTAAGTYAADISGQPFSLPSGSSVTLTNNNFAGRILAAELSVTGSMMEIIVCNNSLTPVATVRTLFSNAAGTASKCNLYLGASAEIILQNNTGFTVTFVIYAIKMS